MKSLSKIFAAVAVVLGMGLGATSCINDLDVEPQDSTTLTWADVQKNPDKYLPEVFAKCYSVLAVSGQNGEGSADLGGMDAGKSCYTRALFILNEKTTDECMWIWTEDGVDNLVQGNWTNGHGLIYGTYSRLYVIIAICNDFIRQLNSTGVDLTHPTAYNCAKQYALEARAIRALAYWNVIDMYGNGGWVDETMAYGDNPKPIKRRELYDKIVNDLKDIIAQWPAENAQPQYGRVGLDGVKMLLAKMYLNAKVYTNGEVDGYQDCLTLCKEIIANHEGGGFQGSGLANHYLALFSADNDRYMPGGRRTAENEILWGIPYEGTFIQAYGGSRYIMAASMRTATMEKDGFVMNPNDYGINDQWGCMHARKEFSDKFIDENDVRDNFWCKEDEGFLKGNDEYMKFNAGYGTIKFTNLRTKEDGTFYMKEGTDINIKNIADESKVYSKNVHPETDFPIFRLADVYLMKAECYVLGGVGDEAEALAAANVVRERSGATPWKSLNASVLLDERGRELYWENQRRSDLVRYGKFTSGYNWAWKGGTLEGSDISSHLNVFPIPANVISAQPEFAAIQNAGY